MNLMENFRMAFSSILAHKLRSILTMLGIIIGVGSVILVVAIGQGGEQALKAQIAGSSNTIEVYYQPSEEELKANPNAMLVDPFTQEDVEALKGIPEVKQVVASTTSSYQIRYKEETIDATVYGINAAYMDVNQLNIHKGRLFTEADFLGGRRVAIISDQLAEDLFKKHNPIGEVVWVSNQPFEIIGILEKPTGIFAFGMSEIYTPWTAYRNAFGQTNYTQVTLEAVSADEIKAAGEKAEQLLNDMHQTEDSYQVVNFEEIAESIGQITRIMTMIIGSIAGISLVVGGIGVMNIMLVSVTERTREIGIRKALGATRRQILLQFLIESMTLTLIGGTFGILLGAGIASIISIFAGWPSLVSWQVVVGGLLFSMFIGILFGLLPANKAARLDPIESLRYE
ncbi:ABC transporter permease [Aeribacillus pallidus]|uniref:ABC transporter permease n=1 Tax=Aeribacillus TaxID=1055323 RepID=UPI0007B4E06F|nr:MULTISPECIES: ABC transporter permease [Aeribacillus]KZM55743.1 macrolide ABC transporter permease [Aeribacillus pallidus]MED0652281.1 ABC transporter permease [Aeribacillus composti]MED4487104.1 ABC transporter permease [Aeribacillus pallidus]